MIQKHHCMRYYWHIGRCLSCFCAVMLSCKLLNVHLEMVVLRALLSQQHHCLNPQSWQQTSTDVLVSWVSTLKDSDFTSFSKVMLYSRVNSLPSHSKTSKMHHANSSCSALLTLSRSWLWLPQSPMSTGETEFLLICFKKRIKTNEAESFSPFRNNGQLINQQRFEVMKNMNKLVFSSMVRRETEQSYQENILIVWGIKQHF